MSQRKDFCGTAKLQQAKLRKRKQRVEAGDTKLAELVRKHDQAARDYSELQRRLLDESLQARDIAAGDTESLMQKSVEAAAFEEARKNLNEYEAELNKAEAQASNNASFEPDPYTVVLGTQLTDDMDTSALLKQTQGILGNSMIGGSLGTMTGPAPSLPEPKCDRRNEIIDKLRKMRSEAALNGLTEEANAEMDELAAELEQLLSDEDS